MRAWMTVELSQKEIDSLFDEQIIGKGEGVSKTPLEMVVRNAYGLMILKQEVRLTITNMKPQSEQT
jgi:hypothetical protein